MSPALTGGFFTTSTLCETLLCSIWVTFPILEAGLSTQDSLALINSWCWPLTLHLSWQLCSWPWPDPCLTIDSGSLAWPPLDSAFVSSVPRLCLKVPYQVISASASSAGLGHTPERNLMTLLLFISKKELITSHLSLHYCLEGSHRLVKSDMSYFSNMPRSSLKASFSGILCSDLSPAPLLISLVSAEVSLSQRSTHRPRVPNSKSQLLPPPLHCASLFL